MKHVYIKLLEQINYYPNKYTNEGLLKILKNECEKKGYLLENYKENFIYIRSTVEELIQSIVDKIITLPYPIRCICKIISVLIYFHEMKIGHLNINLNDIIIDNNNSDTSLRK